MVKALEGNCEDHGQQDGQVAVEVQPPWPDSLVEVEEAKSAGNNHKDVFHKVEPQKRALLGDGIVNTDSGIWISKGENKPDVGQAVYEPG